VEDDERLGEQVVEHLRGEGFAPQWLRDGDEARKVDPDEYALIILDLMLPGTYGLDLLKCYRQSSDVPVLILSARNDTHDKVRGFKLGADDYITKPFWPEELLARVSARLRRPDIRRGEALCVGGLSLDIIGRRAQLDGHDITLTPVEYALLYTLMRRTDAAISRASLLDQALDPDRRGTERTLDVHVSRLRKKLGSEGWRVQTVWGIGYRLSSGEAPA
jgi:two-component system response regulator MtrA